MAQIEAVIVLLLKVPKLFTLVHHDLDPDPGSFDGWQVQQEHICVEGE